MQNTRLQTPIDYLKGVGPSRAEVLRKELGISTYQDLINLFPNRYIDRTRFYKIAQLQPSKAHLEMKLALLNSFGLEVTNGFVNNSKPIQIM
jgi:ATP-dependent DNA helicase RecG